MEITGKQLEGVVMRELFPLGYTRFYRNDGSISDPRLIKGVELLNARRDWAISFFRNVHNEANDVEIAIAPARVVSEPSMAGAALKWLEATRNDFNHGEHAPHHGNYKGDVFRIGLKLKDAQVFCRRFMAEVLKRPSEKPWTALQPSVGMGRTGEPLTDAVPPAVPLAPVPPDDRARAIAHMIAMALSARDQSGLKQTSVVKDKEVRFSSAADFQAHLETLWSSDRCALSGVRLDPTGADPELSPSLDRIDSSKHYEPGNLQVVARFINRWKSDDDVGNFSRLLTLLKAPRGHDQQT